MMTSKNIEITKTYESIEYHELIAFMKEVRTYFQKKYDTKFKLGNIYQGNPSYSYFSLTTEELKKRKLKFVIILNHKKLDFSICLSGQNKNIRKEYWEVFNSANWNKYHLAESIENSLSIIDQTIVKEADLIDKKNLLKQIDSGTAKFMDEITTMIQ